MKFPPQTICIFFCLLVLLANYSIPSCFSFILLIFPRQWHFSHLNQILAREKHRVLPVNHLWRQAEIFAEICSNISCYLLWGQRPLVLCMRYG